MIALPVVASAAVNGGGGGSRTRGAERCRSKPVIHPAGLVDTDLLVDAGACSPVDQGVVHAVDPVAAALEAARRKWIAEHDARALRRLLLRLLTDLNE